RSAGQTAVTLRPATRTTDGPCIRWPSKSRPARSAYTCRPAPSLSRPAPVVGVVVAAVARGLLTAALPPTSAAAATSAAGAGAAGEVLVAAGASAGGVSAGGVVGTPGTAASGGCSVLAMAYLQGGRYVRVTQRSRRFPRRTHPGAADHPSRGRST